MDKEKLLAKLRNIPDFPKPGIQFKDVESLYCDSACLRAIVDELAALYADKGITKVVGIDARGFVLGAALAVRLGAGFVMCRKPGKLPGEKVSASFEKEYGTDTIEMHCGNIGPDDTVLIHDDLLATGGTLAAAARLTAGFSPKAVYINTLIELTGEGLHGRDALPSGMPYTALLTID